MKILKALGTYLGVHLEQTTKNTFVYSVDLSNHQMIRSEQFATLEQCKAAIRFEAKATKDLNSFDGDDCEALKQLLKGVK